jgi:hypothetical protein
MIPQAGLNALAEYLDRLLIVCLDVGGGPSQPTRYRLPSWAVHGDAVLVVAGVQHLNGGFDVHHLLAQPFGFLPVVQILSPNSACCLSSVCMAGLA